MWRGLESRDETQIGSTKSTGNVKKLRSFDSIQQIVSLSDKD